MTTLAWAARDLFTIALNLLGAFACVIAAPLGYRAAKALFAWMDRRAR